MDERPSLLVLSQVLPFPPDTGVSARTHNVLRQLAREFVITALCFHRAKGGLFAADLDRRTDGLRPWMDARGFLLPQDQSRARLLWDHLRSLGARRVYTHYAYESREFEQALRRLLDETPFDLVQLESLDLSRYLPLFEGRPVACTHHNVESRLLLRRSKIETLAPLRAYLRLQSAWMQREEERWCPRIDLNVAVSEGDRQSLLEIAPDARVCVVPNGVDTEYFRPEPGREEGIVFVGGTTWFPNRDALAFFAESILPRLRSRGYDGPIRWVGRATAEEIDRFRAQGIELLGYVDDVRPAVRDAACYVVPLRVGGGTRLKILDAWAMGKAVVTTGLGAEGLEAVDGENALVRDDPDAFAEAVLEVVGDAALRARVGAGGRDTVERLYAWDVVGERMLRDYRSLRVGDGRAAQSTT